MKNPCVDCLVFVPCKNDYENLAYRSKISEDALMVKAIECPFLFQYLTLQYRQARIMKEIMNPLINRTIPFLYNTQVLEKSIGKSL